LILSCLVWNLNILLAQSRPGQSHPGWWTYASPDATALVGMDWNALRKSPFADAMRLELGPDGLGFPALNCIDQAGQILISSPPLLIAATGSCSSPETAREAGTHGFRIYSYKGVSLWVAPQPPTLSVALMTPQVVLLGSRKTLEAAIDRATELAAKEGETQRATVRKYSPLLARAAQFAHDADLWAVSSHFPDPLASRFVPLDVEARGFDGGVSIQNGLRLGGLLTASSSEGALVMAEHLRQNFATLSPLTSAMEIHVDGDQVGFSLTATPEEFTASLRNAPAPVAPGPPQQVVAIVAPAEPLKPAEAPKPPDAPKPVPAEPQVIRIIGLDDGPKEIPFPSPPEVHQ
jgi:hypothetical protein